MPVPPDEKLLRYNVRVLRWNGFPQPLSRAGIGAEAELDADGKSMRITWRSSAHGIAKVEVSEVRTDSGRQVFDLEVAAEWRTRAGAAAASSAMGNMGEQIPVVFRDGKPDSEGYGSRHGG